MRFIISFFIFTFSSSERRACPAKQQSSERGLSLHALSILSAVPPSTLKNIVNGESKNPGTVTIKKLCDGLQITLGEFFNHNIFNSLEQEIK